MVKPARGFAVVFRDQILVDTVSPTERAAMVNWLVVYGGVMIYVSTSDEDIIKHFYQAAGRAGAKLTAVNIEDAHENVARHDYMR